MSPTVLTIFLAIATLPLGVLIARARGVLVGVLWTIALILLAIAWVDPPMPWHKRASVAILVDLSPSTRGMWFRDARAIEEIRRAFSDFADVQVSGFVNGKPVAIDLAKPIAEIESAETLVPEVDADAIALLSDGQFKMQSTRTPLFAIVDPTAASSTDARVADISVDRRVLNVTVDTSSSARQLRWPNGSEQRVDRSMTLHREIDTTLEEQIVSLDPGDLWPENDRASITSASEQPIRFWIGDSVPDGFVSIDARSLDLSRLTSASVVVLNNVPIAALSPSLQQDLARFVRDFGGRLVIGGGAHALSAGGYGNTDLDALSPLSSVPPTPTNDLFVLVDSSGSMASATPDGRSKLDVATDAMLAVDRVVPKEWSLRAGSIARDLRWWPSDADRVKRPSDLVATGPTNLHAAIRAVIDAPASHRKRLILISDGQADAKSLSAVAASIKQSDLIIDWLALPPADANGVLAAIVRESGGQMNVAAAADTWRAEAASLARAGFSSPMLERAINADIPPIGNASISAINRVTLRTDATSLTSTVIDGTDVPLAATWNVGVGKVTTLAFELPPTQLAALGSANARLVRDPRFAVRTDADSITVIARDAKGPMNRLSLTAWVDERATPIEQISPGEYRLAFERSDRSRVANVRLNGNVITNVSVPGRYPQEFDFIGINVDSLRNLAESTGGKLVERGQIASIRPLLPTRSSTSTRTAALLGGMAFLVAALLRSRRSIAQ